MHTSKRMHFIEESPTDVPRHTQENLHTSKRMHFIEDRSGGQRVRGPRMALAYVKTYALH